MPRPRKPFDTAHYETLKAQGFSQRAIARAMRIPTTTLQEHVKDLRTDVAQGPPRAPHGETLEPSATGRPQGDQGIPALPVLGLPEDAQGPPSAALSSELAEALTVAWPDLGELLAWWRDRRQAAQESPEKLERVTYHVAPRWIDAVKREADLDGKSYAAVVNRAFAQYFAGKST